MEYALLGLTVFGVNIQTIFRKNFSLKNENTLSAHCLYGLCLSCGALLFFELVRRIMGAPFTLHLPTMGYAAIFSVMYTSCNILANLAVATGPLGLTSLLSSYALLIPTLFGLIFLNNPVKLPAMIGLVFLLLSLYFVRTKDKEQVFRKGWLAFVIGSMVTNGMCSVMQTLHQAAFPAQYRFEMLEFSMIFTIFLNIGVLGFLCARKKTAPKSVKELFAGQYLAPISGLFNGAVNYLVITLVSVLPAALLFPMVSAGGLLLTGAESLVFYKERYTRQQYLGFFMGLLAVVLMNL